MVAQKTDAEVKMIGGTYSGLHKYPNTRRGETNRLVQRKIEYFL